MGSEMCIRDRFPIGVVFLTVLSLNYAGDRLREVFDTKELNF